MVQNLDAYANEDRERSLFLMVMASIGTTPEASSNLQAQPEAYLQTHFPPGFHDRNRQALGSTDSKLHKQLENVRYQVRNLVCTGILLMGSSLVLP
ncbi:hypothetical protein PTTG_00148 [Puccinia triticina 1-1 BBBD Race 1]|uniref:Uncharacterized protein n=1 Tax=Puccinia triticina (isolate 1-1 / race 1 (BBBD)) TaxID=630390 RepID=A0A180GYI3_PUCT1|nr:hypothetical protein PTTG_00148 [Puccinia triticina 1-1 BBBD Race 1]